MAISNVSTHGWGGCLGRCTTATISTAVSRPVRRDRNSFPGWAGLWQKREHDGSWSATHPAVCPGKTPIHLSPELPSRRDRSGSSHAHFRRDEEDALLFAFQLS